VPFGSESDTDATPAGAGSTTLKRFRILLLTIGAVLAPTASAESVGLFVANPSFEELFPGESGVVFPEAAGWTETGPVDGEPPQFPGITPPPGDSFTFDTGTFFNFEQFFDGEQIVDNAAFIRNAHPFGASTNRLAYLFGDASPQGESIAFIQQLPDVYQAGADYTLAVAVGESVFLPPTNAQNLLTPAMEIQFVYFDDLGDIQVIDMTEILASDLPQDPADKGLLLTDFDLTLNDFDLAQAIGRNIGIVFTPTVGDGGVWTLDNVRVTATDHVPVPEPASMAVLLGVMAFGAFRRPQR